MNDKAAKTPTPTYQFHLQGRLEEIWTDWFAGMTINWVDNETVLTGPVVDQAALHGLLKKIRDLGLPLRSVKQLSDS